jgi:probable HAF family extracellular repeat protein
MLGIRCALEILRGGGRRSQHGAWRSFRPLHLEVLGDRCLLSTYALTDLGFGIAYGINDAGLVVGGGGPTGAFTWDSSHGRQNLEPFGITDPQSDAYGVSPNGLIVGAAEPFRDSPRHAFLYDHGAVTDLGTFGGALSAARGVNDAGQVVGWAYTDVGTTHAFLWDSQNGLQDLSPDWNPASSASAINSSGLIPGSTCCDDRGSHAVVWDSTGGMSDIASGGVVTGALGVNDAGQVVGGYVVNSSNADAFLYDGGTLTDLGNLGHGVAAACAINDAGIIVGGADARNSFEEHGFVYADGVMTDLNDLVPPGSGLTIYQAHGINHGGQIAGVALDGRSFFHAILLTPDDGAAPDGPPDRGLSTALASLGGARSSPGVPAVARAPENQGRQVLAFPVPELAAETTTQPRATKEAAELPLPLVGPVQGKTGDSFALEWPGDLLER